MGDGRWGDMGGFVEGVLGVCERERRVISGREGKNREGRLMGWWE